jgi:hypothetical protein
VELNYEHNQLCLTKEIIPALAKIKHLLFVCHALIVKGGREQSTVDLPSATVTSYIETALPSYLTFKFYTVLLARLTAQNLTGCCSHTHQSK